MQTTNGGDTWALQTSGTSELLLNAKFADINTGYIVGNNGTILKPIQADGIPKCRVSLQDF